jgi:hypothetical protein
MTELIFKYEGNENFNDVYAYAVNFTMFNSGIVEIEGIKYWKVQYQL